LVSGGKVIDSKPLKIVFDPDVKFAPGEHEKYNAIVMDLHALQRRGVAAATALNKIYPEMSAAAAKIAEGSAVPANVKTYFETLNKEFDAVRKKFGVPFPAAGAGGGRGGGGGGRGGGADPDNVLARVTAVKGSIMSIWETPSGSLVKQYGDAK